MGRIVKEEEYAIRRNQILDAALRLVYTKGYGQMTIQDILDDLEISKGAFYHYFDSKGAVLEALIERMMVEVEPLLVSLVEDPRLPALEKLQRYFDTAVRWKTARKRFMLELLRVWYADENAIVRQKLFAMMVERLKPLLTKIIHQGIQEGTFSTPSPEYAGMMTIYLSQGLGDEFATLLITGEPDLHALQQAETAVAAFNDALERVLGAPAGSIHAMDTEAIEVWFTPPAEKEIFPGEALIVSK